MKHIKSIVIIFLINSIWGCTFEPNIKEDIELIASVNTDLKSIKKNLINSVNEGNIIFDDYTNDFSSYNYNLSLQMQDTVYALNYTNTVYKNKTEYNYFGVAFTKSYLKNDNYHVIELFNEDTLYHFISRKRIEDSHPTLDYTFLKGKYFFEAERSGWYHPIDSKTYFYLNIDSLVNVRGDSLPDLPVIDSISFEEFSKSDYYRRMRKNRIYLK